MSSASRLNLVENTTEVRDLVSRASLMESSLAFLFLRFLGIRHIGDRFLARLGMRI